MRMGRSPAGGGRALWRRAPPPAWRCMMRRVMCVMRERPPARAARCRSAIRGLCAARLPPSPGRGCGPSASPAVSAVARRARRTVSHVCSMSMRRLQRANDCFVSCRFWKEERAALALSKPNHNLKCRACRAQTPNTEHRPRLTIGTLVVAAAAPPAAHSSRPPHPRAHAPHA